MDENTKNRSRKSVEESEEMLNIEKQTLNLHQYVLSKYTSAAVIVILSIIATIIIPSTPKYIKYLCTLHSFENISQSSKHKRYWAYGKNTESGYLENVFTVLKRLGYKNDPDISDWDLLWAHDYPFNNLYSKLRNLKPHQRVNKFPGSGYITNKVELSTSRLKYIPAAFRLPKEKSNFMDYAKANGEKKFVQKSNDHRNISIKSISDIDLDNNSTFVQEFVDKPLLISGYKFDIGVYAIITSVDPLRLYIYNGDFLLRFCPVKYHPFDPENIDKYVVGDDYLPTWEVPSLKRYYKTLGFGMAESLNSYLRTKGKDPAKIWHQIEDSIRIVALAKEQHIIDSVKRFVSKTNFFEMMRFDFVVNEELQVFLMEANMSPNLSSAHFPPNRLLFEQIIFNLLGLVGVSETISKGTLAARSQPEEEMRVADKNIMVFPNECNSALCRSGCTSPICQLCMPCLSDDTKNNLLQAYREHINKGTCKRIYPPQISKVEDIDIYEELDMYTPENQLQYRWFQGKCLMDASWCI